jgi:hypothetical protein
MGRRGTMNKNQADLNFIADPMRWPRYPRLPMKRYDNAMIGALPKFAVLIHGFGPMLYFGMYDKPVTSENLEAAEKQEYESYEAIVNDGWIID